MIRQSHFFHLIHNGLFKFPEEQMVLLKKSGVNYSGTALTFFTRLRDNTAKDSVCMHLGGQ